VIQMGIQYGKDFPKTQPIAAEAPRDYNS
jgi:hypothetical protein